MWVSGSLMRSSTWRSSSVSAPCISSSMSLPSSADRSRTMRGSFCQALPIGCMRVRMTPSCSSAVTLDSRCSGTLNSDSSCRRTMSRSWLRVSTSSDTMVIRFSSVSTLTRIDLLATVASASSFAGFSPSDLSCRLGLDWQRRPRGCRDAGPGVSRNTRSSSSSETSPGRSGRSSVCGTSVPTVVPETARLASPACCTICSSWRIRSVSAPSGSR